MSFSAPRLASELFSDPYGASHYGTIIEDRDFATIYSPATGVYSHPYDDMHQYWSTRNHLTLVPTIDDGMAGWSILPTFETQRARDYSWFQQIINNAPNLGSQDIPESETIRVHSGPLVLDGSSIENDRPVYVNTALFHEQSATASEFEEASSCATQELDWAYLPHLPSEDVLDVPISDLVDDLQHESADKLELAYNPNSPDNLCVREDGQIYFTNEVSSDEEAVFDNGNSSEPDSDTSFGDSDHHDSDDGSKRDGDASDSSTSLPGSGTPPDYSSSQSSGQDNDKSSQSDSQTSTTSPDTFSLFSGPLVLFREPLIADLDPAILNVGPRTPQVVSMALTTLPDLQSTLRHDGMSTNFSILDSALLELPSLVQQPVNPEPASLPVLLIMMQETSGIPAPSVQKPVSLDARYDAATIEADITAEVPSPTTDNADATEIGYESVDAIIDDAPSFVWGIEEWQVMDDPAVSLIMPPLSRETVVDPANDKIHVAQLISQLRATAPTSVDNSFLGCGFEYTMPLLYNMLKKHAKSSGVHRKKPDLFADPAIAVACTPLMDGLRISISTRADDESHFAGLLSMLRDSGVPNPVEKEKPAPAPCQPELDFEYFQRLTTASLREQFRAFDDSFLPPSPPRQWYGPGKPSPFGAPGSGRPTAAPKSQANKQSPQSLAKEYSPTFGDLARFAYREAAPVPGPKNEGFGFSAQAGPSGPEAPFVFGRGKTVPRPQADPNPTAPPPSSARRPKIATNAELVDDLLFGIPAVSDTPVASQAVPSPSALPTRRPKIATDQELVDDLLFGIPTVPDVPAPPVVVEPYHTDTQPMRRLSKETSAVVEAVQPDEPIEPVEIASSDGNNSGVSDETIIRHDTEGEPENTANLAADSAQDKKPLFKLPVKINVAAGLRDRVRLLNAENSTGVDARLEKVSVMKKPVSDGSRVASQVSEINRKTSGASEMSGLPLTTPARLASKSSRISSLASNFERKESDTSSVLREISGNSLPQSRLSDSVKSLACRVKELSRFSSLATTVSMVSDKAEKEASVVQDSQIDAVVDKESFVSPNVGRVITTELSTPDSKQISPSAFRIFSPEAATIKERADNRRPIPRGKVTILSGMMDSVTTDDDLEDGAAIEARHSPIETLSKKATKVSMTPTHATPVSKKRVPMDTSSGKVTVPGASSIPHYALPTVSSAAKARPLLHKAVESLKSGSNPVKKTKAIPPLPPMKSKDLPKPTIVATANVELQHPRPARVISPPWAGLRRE